MDGAGRYFCPLSGSISRVKFCRSGRGSSSRLSAAILASYELQPVQIDSNPQRREVRLDQVKFGKQFVLGFVVSALCSAGALSAHAAQIDSDARSAIPKDVQQLIVVDYRVMQNS